MNGQQKARHARQRVNDLMKSGNYTEAASLLEGVCRAAPGNAEARYLLGCCLGGLGRWAEALPVLQQSTDMRPDVPHVQYALGRTQRALRQYQPAVESFSRSLELDSSQASVHLDLANTCYVLQDLARSQQHYREALQLDPALGEAYYGLGCIEQERGHSDRAIGFLQQALEYQPDSVPVLCMLGTVYLNEARVDKSGECFRRALELNPDAVQATAGMASILEYTGDTGKAIELIESIRDSKRPNPALGIALARLCRHTGRCQEAVDYINRLLDSPELTSKRTRKNLHFAVAGALDRLKQYDAAFEHYRAANDSDNPMYDAVGYAQSIGNIIDTYSPALFMRVPRSTRHDKRPVFIIGMPRSGTSLTEQVLAAHPDIHAAGELNLLDRIVREMPRKPGGIRQLPGCVAGLDQQDLDDMADRYLGHLDELAPKALRITDKMPHNFYHVGMIQLLFPDARIIHCTRNPLDNGLSIYFQSFGSGHPYAASLFNIGVHYNQYLRLMAHWKQVVSLPILEVNYEEMVSDQENVTRRMLEFCELEWDEACLRYHEVDRNVQTASYDQVRQPLYTRSVERWRNYEKDIGDLKEGLQRGY